MSKKGSRHTRPANGPIRPIEWFNQILSDAWFDKKQTDWGIVVAPCDRVRARSIMHEYQTLWLQVDVEIVKDELQKISMVAQELCDFILKYSSTKQLSPNTRKIAEALCKAFSDTNWRITDEGGGTYVQIMQKFTEKSASRADEKKRRDDLATAAGTFARNLDKIRKIRSPRKRYLQQRDELINLLASLFGYSEGDVKSHGNEASPSPLVRFCRDMIGTIPHQPIQEYWLDGLAPAVRRWSDAAAQRLKNGEDIFL